jgi:hypothetical protein
VDDYNKPFNSYINYNFAYLSPDISYSSDLFFSLLEINLDDNLFVADPKTYKGITLDRVIDTFSTHINRFDIPNKTMMQVRFKASNKFQMVARSVMKIDTFIANIFSFLLFFFLIFSYFNKIMNNFELKKSLIFALFKNFEVNSAMMKKLKVLQEKYNETEYKQNPDFQEVDQEKVKLSTVGNDKSPDNRLSKSLRNMKRPYKKKSSNK